MLGMLRRARERREERERNCPCKQTCLCHKPAPDGPWPGILLLVLLLAFVIIAVVHPPPPERRTIRVGQKVCDVVFVKTDEKCEQHLLHQECHDLGYDRAVCP
jgi:hypothetical protein